MTLGCTATKYVAVTELKRRVSSFQHIDAGHTLDVQYKPNAIHVPDIIYMSIHNDQAMISYTDVVYFRVLGKRQIGVGSGD